MDGFVFFRLSYFYYSDLQLFSIFIFEVDFSETYLMTSAEKSVLEPLNLTIFRGRIPPEPPYKARTFGTRDSSALGDSSVATKWRKYAIAGIMDA